MLGGTAQSVITFLRRNDLFSQIFVNFMFYIFLQIQYFILHTFMYFNSLLLMEKFNVMTLNSYIVECILLKEPYQAVGVSLHILLY